MRSITKIIPKSSSQVSKQIRYSTTSQPKPESKVAKQQKESQQAPHSEAKLKKKSQTQLDRELQEKMAGIAGDGGDAGLELEDGKAVSMKRGVRENMFRYI